MGFFKNLIMRVLWGVPAELPKHNCSDLSVGMLRMQCGELLDSFSSAAEQCWDTGKSDKLEEIQLLAEWFGQELKKAVGHPPTVN